MGTIFIAYRGRERMSKLMNPTKKKSHRGQGFGGALRED